MYKGDLKGFPKEVVEKILEQQVEQGNEKDISIFEKYIRAGKFRGGFDWDTTTEGDNFWRNVLIKKNFDLFFQKYPKKQYPKVMIVSNNNDFSKSLERVVFMEKNGKFLSWHYATTLEEAEKINHVTTWDYAKDIEQTSIEITVKINGKTAKLSDISDETLKRLREF